MTSKLSLYQALKQTGNFSTKEEIVTLVNSKRVTIDGIPTAALKFQFSPKKRKVCIDGNPISYVTKRYIVMNKPAGYSCQKNDNFSYIVSLLPFDNTTKNSLFPIGRLDVPTTGLLIITNDGTLSALLAEPKRKVTKTYHALLKLKITDEQIMKLQQGVLILVDDEQYKTLPADVEKKDDHNIIVVITEGKSRQIRKMLEAVGNKVAALQRVAIGNLQLGNLAKGDWKEYSEEELKQKLLK